MQLPRVVKIRRWRVGGPPIATARAGIRERVTLQPCADEPRTLCGKTVDEWIGSRGAARTAGGRSRALGSFGPDARAAVPDLVDLLRDELEGSESFRGVLSSTRSPAHRAGRRAGGPRCS